MADIENKTLMLIISLIAGVYAWLLKHLSNSQKHPNSDEIVYKDVCVANRDCIEAKIDGLQKVVETRFDGLEDLIQNGGQKKPRITT